MRKIITDIGKGHDDPERNCKDCNWNVSVLYRFEGEHLDEGRCSECFMNRLMAEQKEEG